MQIFKKKGAYHAKIKLKKVLKIQFFRVDKSICINARLGYFEKIFGIQVYSMEFYINNFFFQTKIEFWSFPASKSKVKFWKNH